VDSSVSGTKGLFDFNIEQVLERWLVSFAARGLTANSLAEHAVPVHDAISAQALRPAHDVTQVVGSLSCTSRSCWLRRQSHALRAPHGRFAGCHTELSADCNVVPGTLRVSPSDNLPAIVGRWMD
jgi:hypothetical protein